MGYNPHGSDKWYQSTEYHVKCWTNLHRRQFHHRHEKTDSTSLIATHGLRCPSTTLKKTTESISRDTQGPGAVRPQSLKIDLEVRQSFLSLCTYDGYCYLSFTMVDPDEAALFKAQVSWHLLLCCFVPGFTACLDGAK